MPIDYSRGMIYKLTCRNPDITKIYVGSTVDWTRRKASHKCDCNNPNSSKHHLFVYEFIREHGGWDNWHMILIENYPCNSKRELEARENYWANELHSTLNSMRPYVSDEMKRKEHIERSAKWNKDNKERYNEICKKYMENNKEKRKERITCELCGVIHSKGGTAQHKRTNNRHLKALAELEEKSGSDFEFENIYIDKLRASQKESDDDTDSQRTDSSFCSQNTNSELNCIELDGVVNEDPSLEVEFVENHIDSSITSQTKTI